MFTGGEEIDWSALLDWYLSVFRLIEDFDSCQVVVDPMLSGTTEANLVGAELLAGLTRDAELWLLSHPCPEPWNGEHMVAIVHTYMAIGTLIVDAEGDPDRVDEVEMKELIGEAALMVQEVKDLVARLIVAIRL
jgi:hypothetical protein